MGGILPVQIGWSELLSAELFTTQGVLTRSYLINSGKQKTALLFSITLQERQGNVSIEK